MLLQLTSKLANLITSLPINSPDDVMQRNDMVAGLVSNPEAVSTETAVSNNNNNDIWDNLQRHTQ